MDEKQADIQIFKDRGFLLAQGMSCGILIIVALVIWYVQR